MKRTLSLITVWRREETLRVNQEKTTLIPFTKKEDHIKSGWYQLSEETLPNVNYDKYLGMVLQTK